MDLEVEKLKHCGMFGPNARQMRPVRDLSIYRVCAYYDVFCEDKDYRKGVHWLETLRLRRTKILEGGYKVGLNGQDQRCCAHCGCRAWKCSLRSLGPCSNEYYRDTQTIFSASLCHGSAISLDQDA